MKDQINKPDRLIPEKVEELPRCAGTFGAYNCDRGPTKGQNSDPANTDMHAFFLAHGPAYKSGITVPAFENIQLYNLMARVLEIEPAENDGDIELVKDILVQ